MKSKGFAPILILIVLGLVVLLVPLPYYQFTEYSCKIGQSCPQKGWHPGKSLALSLWEILRNSPLSRSEPKTSTPDSTADWKTYTDPAGYFFLKYPPTMVLKNDHQSCESELVLANKDTGFSSKYQGDFVIDVCKIDKEFYPRAAFGNIIGKEEKITLDSKEGFVKTGEATFYKIDSKVQIKRLVFYENGADYVIDLRYIPGNPDFTNIFDQILSTFKFLEQTSDASTWQTYINTEFRYSIQYPPTWRTQNVAAGAGDSEALPNSRQIDIFEKDYPRDYKFEDITIQALDNPTLPQKTTVINSLTMYVFDTQEGEVYYIKVPSKNTYLEFTGAGGHTVNEDKNGVIKKIFSTFKFIQ